MIIHMKQTVLLIYLDYEKRFFKEVADYIRLFQTDPTTMASLHPTHDERNGIVAAGMAVLPLFRS